MKPVKNFDMHPCGLGTFLDIASRTITEKLRNREYTPAEAVCLESSALTALYFMGMIAEKLGAERLEDAEPITPTGNPSAAALMLIGRATQEMAYLVETTKPYANRHYQNVQAAIQAEGDTFPPESC